MSTDRIQFASAGAVRSPYRIDKMGERWFVIRRADACVVASFSTEDDAKRDREVRSRRGHQLSCGCCAGPEEDRCVCWNHQDRRIGRVPHKCSLHCEAA